MLSVSVQTCVSVHALLASPAATFQLAHSAPAHHPRKDSPAHLTESEYQIWYVMLPGCCAGGLQAVPLGLTSLAAMARIARHHRGRFNTVVRSFCSFSISSLRLSSQHWLAHLRGCVLNYL